LTEYFCCVICGANRVVEKLDGERYSFEGKWNENNFIVQVRTARGKIAGDRKGRGQAKGGGFPLDEDRSMLLSEIIGKPEYKDILDSLKKQFISSFRALEKEGVLTREEL